MFCARICSVLAILALCSRPPYLWGAMALRPHAEPLKPSTQEQQEPLPFLKGFNITLPLPSSLLSVKYDTCRAFLQERFGPSGRPKTLEKVFWMHIPKSGTTFAATIFAYVCHEPVETGKERLHDESSTRKPQSSPFVRLPPCLSFPFRSAPMHATMFYNS